MKARPKCFACREFIRGKPARHGRYKTGGRWYLCRACQKAARANHELDKEAYVAAGREA